MGIDKANPGFLTLTRAEGEDILIGDEIVVRVVRVKDDGRVRIGVHAPQSVKVDRREVRERIERGEPR